MEKVRTARLYLSEVFVLDDLKVSELILLLCAAQQRMERGVLTPEMVMVKRKTESYELLPDHRLFMIISIVLRSTGADRLSVTHTSLAHIIYMSPGHNA